MEAELEAQPEHEVTKPKPMKPRKSATEAFWKHETQIFHEEMKECAKAIWAQEKRQWLVLRSHFDAALQELEERLQNQRKLDAERESTPFCMQPLRLLCGCLLVSISIGGALLLVRCCSSSR